MAEETRRMLTPWRIEQGDSSFTVRTANGFVVSVTYFDDDPNRAFNLRREEARKIAIGICPLPKLLAKNRDEKVPLPHRNFIDFRLTNDMAAESTELHAGSRRLVGSEQMTKKRRRFKQSTPLKERLAAWAADVRAEAAKLKPGAEQDAMLQRARRADTASHLDEWANSVGLQSPK